MQELDLLLMRYVERQYADASSDDRELFAELLGWQDPELARYLLAGETHSDHRIAAMVRQLRTP